MWLQEMNGGSQDASRLALGPKQQAQAQVDLRVSKQQVRGLP